MIFETGLFALGKRVNERGYGSARPDLRSGLILGDLWLGIELLLEHLRSNGL